MMRGTFRKEMHRGRTILLLRHALPIYGFEGGLRPYKIQIFQLKKSILSLCAHAMPGALSKVK
jgi:hypothetical protein